MCSDGGPTRWPMPIRHGVMPTSQRALGRPACCRWCCTPRSPARRVAFDLGAMPRGISAKLNRRPSPCVPRRRGADTAAVRAAWGRRSRPESASARASSPRQRNGASHCSDRLASKVRAPTRPGWPPYHPQKGAPPPASSGRPGRGVGESGRGGWRASGRPWASGDRATGPGGTRRYAVPPW